MDQAVIATVAPLRKCPTLNMARRFPGGQADHIDILFAPGVWFACSPLNLFFPILHKETHHAKEFADRWLLSILFSRLKRPFLLAALLLASALSGTSLSPSRVASTATCDRPEMIVVYYYSDETYQQEVGQRHYWCDGRNSSWGIMTLYDWQETISACCNCAECL